MSTQRTHLLFSSPPRVAGEEFDLEIQPPHDFVFNGFTFNDSTKDGDLTLLGFWINCRMQWPHGGLPKPLSVFRYDSLGGGIRSDRCQANGSIALRLRAERNIDAFQFSMFGFVPTPLR